MVLPNFGLLSMGITALCIGMVLSVKVDVKKQMLRCKKCGETQMSARSGHIICKNGHRVTLGE